MGNIILLRKSRTHHHNRVGRQLSSFRVRNFLYLGTYNNCAVQNVPKKKIIINKLVCVRKHITIIRLRLENFLVGINFSVFANQPLSTTNRSCAVYLCRYVILFTHLYIQLVLYIYVVSIYTQTLVHFLRIKVRNRYIYIGI